MTGTPLIGRPASMREPTRQPAPAPEVLGVIKQETLDPGPQTASWSGPSGQVSVTEYPPPPWEQGGEEAESDARRYVDAPDNVTLHWINPRLLESMGWRYWQPVLSGDKRFRIKVAEMIGPDGNVRRGGMTGDILAWMPTSWVESRRRQNAKKTADQTEKAVNAQQTLREEFRRGTYGPHLKLEEARHPTHTMLEGKSIRD